MKENTIFLYIFLMAVMIGCKPVSKKVVVANTENYTKLISAESNVGFDLDENEVDPLDERFITLIIKNNSIADLRNLYLELEDGQSFIKFKAAGDGTRKNPGFGGTCKEVLHPEDTCTFELSFTPVKRGNAKIGVTVHYTNLITPDSATYYFTALVGTPAELVFKNGITSYNLGNIEQTDTTVRTLAIEIQNNGELSARALTPSIINLEGDPAYSIFRNDCPVKLKGGQSCFITLGYAPVNNDPEDLPKLFLGSMIIDYWKNPKADAGKIISNFSFNSFRIEADFTPANIQTLGYSNLTVGNFEEKNLTVTNIGHRSGRLVRLELSNGVTCAKSGSQVELSCTPVLGASSFPYKIYDDNNCFGKEINGINNNQLSGTCAFRIRYWPSVILTSTTAFSAFDVDLVYDSQWKGIWGQTFKTIKIGRVNGVNANSAGVLSIENADITAPNLPTSSLVSPVLEGDGVRSFNLGSVSYFEPGASPSATFYRVRMNLRNVGGSTLRINEIYDGAANGLKIITATNTGTLNFKYYYTFSQGGCSQIAPGQSCTVTYNFVPKDSGNGQTNLENAYDVVDTINNNFYKVFNLKYSTGATIDDSGSNLADKIDSIKHRISLNARGFLQITSAPVSEFILMNTVITRKITLKNIGNGSLQIRRSDNLAFNVPLNDPSVAFNSEVNSVYKPTFPFRLLDDSIGTKCGFYSGPDITLAAGESCTIQAEFKHPVELKANAGSYQYPFYLGVDTTISYANTSNTTKDITFTYLANPGEPTPIILKTNPSRMTVNFQSEGEIVPSTIEPMISGVIYRSAYSTPLVNNSGYPLTNTSYGAQNIPALYWDYQGYAHHFLAPTTVDDVTMPIRNFYDRTNDVARSANYSSNDYMSYYNKLHKAMNSMIHLKNLMANNQIVPTNDLAANNAEDNGSFGRYVIHGGTTPVGVALPITIKFNNPGFHSVSSIGVTADSTAAPFSYSNTMGTTLTNRANSGILKITFNPSAPGIYSRCYNITFNSGLRNRVTRFCVYAEAVSLNYNLSSIQAGQTVADYNNRPLLILAGEDSGFKNITSTINNTDDSKYSMFSIIKDSLVTITKNFKIKNNSNVTINKISNIILTSKTSSNASYTGAETSYTSIIIRRTGFTKSNPSNAYCSNNISLAPGEECEIQITYDPTGKGFEELNYYLSATYELQKNQYVYQTASIRFKNAEPAGLAVFNTTFAQVLSAPAIDIGYYNPVSNVRTTVNNSYSLSINSNPVNKEGTAYYLGSSDAFNTFTIRVENPTDLRATFLSQWVKHALYNGSNFDSYYNSLTDASFSGFPTTEFVEIFKDNINSVIIEANRYCFFGDEEGSQTLGVGHPNYIPIKYQGFSRFSQNICRMKLHFSGYRTFSGTNCVTQTMGLSIVAACNPFNYALSYVTANNTVGVSADINMHMSGFMKPNNSKSSSVKLTDMEVVSAGIARIELPDLTPSDSNRGSVLGGLLCYDKDYSKINSTMMYNLLTDFKYNNGDVTRVSNNIDIENCVFFHIGDPVIDVAGLTPGNYYFFKPFAIREFNSGKPGENKLVYSSVVDMTVSTAFVPTETQTFSYQNGWLVDKYLRPEIGVRSLALSTCSAQKQNLKLVGIDRQISKSLINTSVFNYIIQDPDYSAGYPNEGVGAITHWLSDTPYDIGSSISLYNGQVVSGFPNFSLNLLDGMSEQHKAVYHLTCNNSPDCQLLYKLVGGDPGEGIFYEGVFYTSANAVNATIRCYSELLCPTNPNISINSINCIAP